MDPELNKLLLSNEEKLVQVYFPSIITRIVGPILTVHGARHRRLRELATTLLSPAAIQAHHVRPLQDHALAILRPWQHSPRIDAQQESKKFIFTYIVKMLLSLEPEDPKTVKLMKDYLCLMTGYSSIPIDFPGTTYNMVLKGRERIVSIFKNILRLRRKEAREEPLDFMDVLLKEMDESGRPFSEQEIVEFIFFLVLGGFETASILLTNVIKFLSENAHVLDELRREHTLIRRSKKENEKLTWDDFKQMQFTELVVKESLRMASIVHYVTRESLQDIAFKDMIIPKGWMILMNFAMVHLNPNHYPNPLKFDPWRWMDLARNNHAFLMPFGGGIRSCLGSILAKFEVSIFIHYLVTLYKWDRIIEKDGQLDEVSSLSFPSMRKGLPIRVESLPF